jgi:DNA adenine methylase
LVPFLKWAGGKRWLARNHVELLPEFSGVYIEPFLGGGAVYFHLNPSRAVLNDQNPDLVNTYRAIKRAPGEVEKLLEVYQRKHSDDFYYHMRSSAPRSPTKRAARFLYLNRTCWNGLYRVNRQGAFNVPVGTKSNVVLPTDNFSAISKRLKRASLRSGDFAKVMTLATKGDLVFADPPYTVNHNLNGFLKYNESLFSWNDQIRLHAEAVAAVKRGAKVAITNADHESIWELYKEDLFTIHILQRFSKLSGENKGRKAITEILIVGQK